MSVVNGQYRRPQLRNKAINYRYGWFFVTFQVYENKSELGAIVGEACVLNALGQAVKKLIETLPQFNPEVYVDCFQVMPNHVHMLIKIEAGRNGPAPQEYWRNGPAPQEYWRNGPVPQEYWGDNPAPQGKPQEENRLARIMRKLKSLTAREYRLLKGKGEARDIGSHLWQANYWEKIVTNHEQLEAIRAYIANNPKRWSLDRFGPVTTFWQGNLGLLDEPLVAFVASQEARADALAPREWRGATPNTLGERGAPQNSLGERGRCAPPVISTFTSPQEREVLRRLLARRRRFIAVYPGGLPMSLPRGVDEAVEAGRALVLSPVATGTGVNKQCAVWCNEYVVRRAKTVWCGAIKPGGTLESILKGARGLNG